MRIDLPNKTASFFGGVAQLGFGILCLFFVYMFLFAIITDGKIECTDNMAIIFGTITIGSIGLMVIGGIGWFVACYLHYRKEEASHD